ncbi:MAG: hypothetical protein ACXVCP_03565 [Bdellovibrio sp.]
MFFLLGAAVTEFLVFTAVCYYSIHFLAEANRSSESSKHLADQYISFAENPNIKEMIKIGKLYTNELNIFDKLMQQIDLKQAPDICETLCNAVYLDKAHLSGERSSYLASYYNQSGTKSLTDPLFRLRLEEIGFISTLYPPALRELLNKILEKSQNGELVRSDKLNLTFKLETALAKQIYYFYIHRHELFNKADEIKTLRHLQQSCQKGTPKTKIIPECKSRT